MPLLNFTLISSFLRIEPRSTFFFKGRCKNGLYTLPIKCQAFFTSRISPEQWHQQIGHSASQITLTILQGNNIVVDIEITPFLIYNARQLGKSHQLSFNLSSHIATIPL
jgi:hypothetical protein